MVDTALTPLAGLPDEAFFDITTTFLRAVDGVYFSDFGLQDVRAVHIRTIIFKRIVGTKAWKRHLQEPTRTELHFGPPMAVTLFNDYWTFQGPPTCYLNPKGIDDLGPFLPMLKEIGESAQFTLAVIALLNLLEVAPRAEHLPVIVAAGKTWLAAHPDDRKFWIDQGFGRRLCALVEAILAQDPNSLGVDLPLRKDIDKVLGGLVQMSVAEAHRLEERLRLI
jgi:hypothetical protein